ncbi:hypothetical protein MF271_10405 [Deinococcus sp. KNUC1210]|uniref:hypothetical protein n=1 Tax=Deinococcus sp. KNUC1210 TaxID=2917691 RepID=UPI001EF010CB|nr:hypothetical protein [Deinococcus sp. KNUC1210]ULH14447.1 hypothetical protein MF271_10405 [Deinococcus sp. KNUC1210]
MSSSPSSSLPARVRVSRLPLPPAQNVRVQLNKLFPALDVGQADAAAVALAGGRVVGAALRFAQQPQPRMELDPSWRGKGLEAALSAAVSSETGDPVPSEQQP